MTAVFPAVSAQAEKVVKGVHVAPDGFQQIAKIEGDFKSLETSSSSEDTLIKENQVIEINKSLRNVIEENQRLLGEKQRLEEELQQIRGEQASGQKMVENLQRDKNDLADSVKKVRQANRQYSQQIKTLEENVQQLQLVKNQSLVQAKTFQSDENFFGEDNQTTTYDTDETPSNEDMTDETPEITTEMPAKSDVKKREEKTLDLLTKIDAFAEGDEHLRLDSAKAHYNMGNIYFQKGEYELAGREYYQAVTLMPNDPDTHYNLAYVSGEHLRDYKMALKHYQIYLYLNPQAEDRNFVKERIMQAKLFLRSLVDSPLEKKKKK